MIAIVVLTIWELIWTKGLDSRSKTLEKLNNGPRTLKLVDVESSRMPFVNQKGGNDSTLDQGDSQYNEFDQSQKAVVGDQKKRIALLEQINKDLARTKGAIQFDKNTMPKKEKDSIYGARTKTGSIHPWNQTKGPPDTDDQESERRNEPTKTQEDFRSNTGNSEHPGSDIEPKYLTKHESYENGEMRESQLELMHEGLNMYKEELFRRHWYEAQEQKQRATGSE
jgi:hypothetical protein